MESSQKSTGIVSGLIALLLFFCVSPSASLASDEKDFCSKLVIRDYAGNVESIRPKLRPPSGQLPFAPPGLRIYSSPDYGFAVGAGRIGFELTSTTSRRYLLNWTVSTTLRRVGTKKQVPMMQSESRRIGTAKHLDADPIQMEFAVPNQTATYRLDLRIRDSGQKPHHYVLYARNVKKSVDVKLGLDAESYRPGHVMTMRVEELGSSLIGYGYEFAIERQTAEGWTPDPSTPPGFIQPGLSVGGGRSGRCQRFTLPLTMQPGAYRILKPVHMGLTGKRFSIVTPFTVLPL